MRAVQFTMENGLMTKQPTKAKSCTQIKTNMRATSSMAKNTEKECIIINPEESSRESGSLIKNTATESLTMPMATDMRVTGVMASELTTVSTNTPMAMFTMESGGQTLNKDTESCRWLLETGTREIGREVKRTVAVMCE